IPRLLLPPGCQRPQAARCVGRASTRFYCLPRQRQAKSGTALATLNHEPAEVAQPQLMLRPRHSFKFQPVRAAFISLPVCHHHLAAACITLPKNPLAEITFPPGPEPGIVITV